MSADPKLLSPEYSPVKLVPTGVRRVNNLPIYFIGGGVAAFLLMIGMVAYDRGQQKAEVGPDTPANKTGSMTFAKEIVGNLVDGMIPEQKPAAPPETPKGKPPEPEIEVPIARPGQGGGVDLNKPPVPPSRASGNEQQDNDLQRIHARKIEQLETALAAKTNVPVTDFRSKAAMGLETGPKAADLGPTDSREAQLQRMEEIRKRVEAIRTEDPNNAYKAHLAQIQEGLGGSGGDTAAAPRLVPAGGSAAPWLQPLVGGGQRKPNNDIGQFAGTGQPDRWRLNSTAEPPRTPYELRAGFVIPATMISGINSELPGQIMAQVSQGVYDTPTGKHLLIPQGARLVGSYSSDIAYGQKRVLVAWQRIVFPDGKAMDIGAMPGADGAGYAGFNDQVDNHYLRIFGSALLMSAVIAGVSYSQQNLNNTGTPYGQQQTASGALSQAVGQQFGTVIAQMVSKNMNIAPTLEIRPGFRFNVMVIKDLTFNKPYQSFDY